MASITISSPLKSRSEGKVAHISTVQKILETKEQFRYIEIKPNTIDLSMSFWGINPTEPRTEVYCFKLNFNISKLVNYSRDSLLAMTT